MSLLDPLLAYIPPDRRNAIATGQELPSQMDGTALWADLSGFTSLTEALVAKHGARQGVEELASRLNQIYTAIIEPVESHGGSVIDFSGDAINCWFDADDSTRAIAAAQAIQIAFQPFEQLQLSTSEKISLGIKIAIARGPVRRIRVGNPTIQYIDVLTGITIDHLGIAGNLARTGEILLDEAAVSALHPIQEWRSDPETGRRAAVLNYPESIPSTPANPLHFPILTEEQIRPWVLTEVFDYLQSGQGEFLTELRPAVALFVGFEGLNYDDQEAGARLDALVQHVQDILAEYDGTLLQLTMDNKGSYIYAAFGAPTAHENNVTRAAAAALKLSRLPQEVSSIQSVSMGMSQGLMRTGGYGGATRRTYGVLGEDVNLAARLMQHAAPGQIIVSESIWRENTDFRWENLPALNVKGRQTSVLPAQLLAWREQNILNLPQSTTALPMVGRQAELTLVQEKLALARQGQGQIVSIVGEAGLGKSRLLAEVLQSIDDQPRYGGECQSYGMHSAYLVWQPIWRAFFGLADATASADQLRVAEQVLTQINPDFIQRLPLLDVVLNISIPENNLTNATEVKLRKTLRETMLVECIRTRAMTSPLTLILEDLHWSDPLSLDLLEAIGRTIESLPVLILIAHRPQAERDKTLLPNLSDLAWYTSIRLVELAPTATEELIASRLLNFGLTGPVPPKLVKRLLARTQGNPFYIEELLNYQHDRGLDPRDDAIWEQGDLPDSLHSLILSRIDQLSHHQQITIKAASIIGRFFRARWLYEYYPSLNPTQIANDLNTLDSLDFIVQDTPEPQLAYLFKHVITQEVAYENLAYATRANMHQLFAGYLEQIAGEDVGPFLDLLAYHYDRSDNLPKKREYLRKAGEVAQKTYANEAALSYLDRALALVPETDYSERFALLGIREKVYQITGNREAQKQDVTAIVELAETLNDNQKRAQAALQLSRFHIRSDPQKTIAAAQQALKWAQLVSSNEQEINAEFLLGQALWTQGNYAEARPHYERSLQMAEKAKSIQWIAVNLDSLGALDLFNGNYDSAQIYLERALEIATEIGSPTKKGATLYNLGEIAYLRGDFAKAQICYEQSLDSFRMVNFQLNAERSLCRVGSMFFERRDDYEKAEFYTKQALLLAQQLKDTIGHVGALHGLSTIDLARNHYQDARTQAQQGLDICREIGFKYFEGMCLVNLGTIADELGEYALALEHHQNALSILREVGEPSLTSQILVELGRVFYHVGKYESALEYNQEALSIAKEKITLLETRALISQGHILRELGDLDQSLSFYQEALHLVQGTSLPDCYSKQAETGMVSIALAQGDLTHIQSPLNEILTYLETHSLSTIDESFWIYLTCYQTLQAINDTRSHTTLERAYTALQNITEQIGDEALKASFLQNVRVNREIVEVWGNFQK